MRLVNGPKGARMGQWGRAPADPQVGGRVLALTSRAFVSRTRPVTASDADGRAAFWGAWPHDFAVSHRCRSGS